MQKTKYVIAPFMAALMLGGSIFNTPITAFANSQDSVTSFNVNVCLEETKNLDEFDYLQLNKEKWN